MQPLAGGLQTLRPQLVAGSPQTSAKQLPEQQSLSWPHPPPLGCKVWHLPFSQRWQGPHGPPHVPPQPSKPQTLPAQSGVQKGVTQKGSPEHWV